jgi:hypothetical protein
MNRVHRGLLIAPLAAVALGCGTIRGIIKDVQHIQSCATQRSSAEHININLTTTKRFTIGLINAPIDTLPAEARAAAARHVAECVRDNYRRYASLNEVAVVFTRRTTTGGVKVSESGTPMIYTTKDLGQPAAAGADSTAGRARAPN